MFGGEAANPERLWIKICGITNAADAQAAVESGADSLGFNCWPRSKRYVELSSASSWIGPLPSRVGRVAVLVNPELEEAVAVARLPFITGLQLHGAETPEFGARLVEQRIQFAKALPVTEVDSLDDLPFYGTNSLVLDSANSRATCIFEFKFARSVGETWRSIQ